MCSPVPYFLWTGYRELINLLHGIWVVIHIFIWLNLKDSTLFYSCEPPIPRYILNIYNLKRSVWKFWDIADTERITLWWNIAWRKLQVLSTYCIL